MQLQNAKPFLEHHCVKCGITDEAKFILGSVHLKQVCNHCGFYVKFFDKTKLPSTAECEFIELKGLGKQLMYWRLYLKIRDYAKNTSTNSEDAK